jgi:hypothetical protein
MKLILIAIIFPFLRSASLSKARRLGDKMNRAFKRPTKKRHGVRTEGRAAGYTPLSNQHEGNSEQVPCSSDACGTSLPTDVSCANAISPRRPVPSENTDNPSLEGKIGEISDERRRLELQTRALKNLVKIRRLMAAITERIGRKKHSVSSLENIKGRLAYISVLVGNIEVDIKKKGCTGLSHEGALDELSKIYKELTSTESPGMANEKDRGTRNTDLIRMLNEVRDHIRYVGRYTRDGIRRCFRRLHKTWRNTSQMCTRLIGATIGYRKGVQRLSSSRKQWES